jgi:hypothetical protein
MLHRRSLASGVAVSAFALVFAPAVNRSEALRGTGPGGLMTGQDYLDAGLPIPGMHPTLPVCPPPSTDGSSVGMPVECQADARHAIFTPAIPRPPRR